MNEFLIGIQRDVVIDYMRLEKPVLKVICDNQEEVFFDLQSSQYTLQQAVIILSSKSIPQWILTEKIDVTVRFYFQKRGLQFDSVLQVKGSNAAIGIADKIEKVSDDENVIVPVYNGKLLYTENSKRQSFVPCVSNNNFPLFEPRIWFNLLINDETNFFFLLDQYSYLRQAVLPPSIEKLVLASKKILYAPGKKVPQKSPFYSDLCITAADITKLPKDTVALIRDEFHILTESVYIPVGKDTPQKYVSVKKELFSSIGITEYPQKTVEQLLFMIPACFLCDDQKKEGSVLDRIPPIEILYFSDEYICFGCTENTISFAKDQKYDYSMQIGIRTISVQCQVNHVLKRAGKIAAICRITQIKPEDKRFLFEKQYNIQFTF